MLEGKSGADRDLRADDAVAAVKTMLDREHVHRAALAPGDAGSAAGQFGHDEVGIDAVGEHMTMVAIAGDDPVAPDLERGLETDRDRLLADIEVTEAADQTEAVKLPGFFLEPANEQHLPVEFEQFLLGGVIRLGLGRPFAIGIAAALLPAHWARRILLLEPRRISPRGSFENAPL